MQNIGLKYGVISGLVYIIISLITYLLGWAETRNAATGVLTWALGFFITFYLVYLAAKNYRDEENNGALSVGEGIKIALIMAIVAGVLASIYSIINMKYIDPDVVDRMMDASREDWERQGMDQSTQDQAEKFLKMFFNPALIVPFTIIFYAIGGLIKGAIVGSILKKEENMIA